MTSGVDRATSNPTADTTAALTEPRRPITNGPEGRVTPRPPRSILALRLTANLVAAFGAALFLRAGIEYYQRTHSLIGAIFVAEEMWVVIAYLVRRPARVLTQRRLDWLLAFGGTFGGVLLRPSGAHPHWGVVAGLDVQLIGIVICVASFAALGRSFGFAAADRGLKVRGPYALIRHPIYASYFFLQIGYLLQSLSWRNAVIVTFICGCNIGRARAEERLLTSSTSYDEYRAKVRWRLLPGVW